MNDRSSTGAGPEDSSALSLKLECRAPFDGEALMEFLAKRVVAGVEEVIDGSYRRSLRLPHGPGTVELRPFESHVCAQFRLVDLRDLGAAIQRCRALLDLDSDPQSVSEVLGRDAVLGQLLRLSPGRRVPGATDSHELAVRAVLGQQVTLGAASKLAAHLVRQHGEKLDRPLGGVTHLFPEAASLTELDRESGMMPAARRRALAGLASALQTGELVIDHRADRAEARRRLLALPGIGPWTAEYIAMRAMRDPDAFLPTDVGVRRALARLGLACDPVGVERLADRWRPYRSYAVQHLWASLVAA